MNLFRFVDFLWLFSSQIYPKTRIWQPEWLYRKKSPRTSSNRSYFFSSPCPLSDSEYFARIDFFLLSLSFQLEANATTVQFDRDKRRKLLCEGQNGSVSIYPRSKLNIYMYKYIHKHTRAYSNGRGTNLLTPLHGAPPVLKRPVNWLHRQCRRCTLHLLK